MTTITVYDPAMCCSTGICGTDVDQKLIALAADLDWLKAQGVTVQRFGLSREPAEFMTNAIIRDLLQVSNGDDLPAILVDGQLASKARYPSRAELADWAGITATGPAGANDTAKEGASGGCCGTAEATPAASSGCCGSTAEATSQKAGGCC